MDNITQLLIALGVLSMLVILRSAMNSESTPEWFANGADAAVQALLLTIAFAGSVFFLDYVLSFSMSGSIAFFAIFATHGALFALCSFVLPPAERAPQQQGSFAPNQTGSASA